MVVIGESLGESIQRGRGRGGRGYMERGSYFLILVNHTVCNGWF